MDGLQWKNLSKWMIWGVLTPYFWFNTQMGVDQMVMYCGDSSVKNTQSKQHQGDQGT